MFLYYDQEKKNSAEVKSDDYKYVVFYIIIGRCELKKWLFGGGKEREYIWKKGERKTENNIAKKRERHYNILAIQNNNNNNNRQLGGNSRRRKANHSYLHSQITKENIKQNKDKSNAKSIEYHSHKHSHILPSLPNF